jgi:trehalose 6-phosphate synthase
LAQRPLILVSNRGPVTFDRDEHGARVERRGAGGLATALRGLRERREVTWIASATTDEDRAVAREGGGEVVLLAHDRRAYDLYYGVVANPFLWFVQHSLWDRATEPELGPAFHEAWREGYERVNRSFADAVVAELDNRPDAVVWFHDYHLYLAPRLVRERRPDALVSHFVHIPWPQSDYWHVLPEPFRRAVHEGLLACDVVGFHASRWRRNFLRCCEDLLGAEVDAAEGVVRHDGRRTLVLADPIGVDTADFEQLARAPAVLEEERRLAAARPERLVLRVDRTDPSKNIVRGFRAFALYLQQHPEMHGRVSLLALLDPSRQEIPEYRRYVAAIEAEASAVNERYGSDDWLPVDLRTSDNFPQSVAAYKQYDVLLVNALFDGLNLVSKEAPLVNERDGVVVLSENAGSHEELAPWTLTVNPLDVLGQAEALHEALSLDPAERRERAEGLRAHLCEHDLARWLAGQLAALDGAAAARRSGSG